MIHLQKYYQPRLSLLHINPMDFNDFDQIIRFGVDVGDWAMMLMNLSGLF